MKEQILKVECRLCGEMTDFRDTVKVEDSLYFCRGHTREEIKSEMDRTRKLREVTVV